ncbi:MAG: preprotein translocase subunit SecE [Gammaproteobacteria bacterium]|nr:preprotein translocase subunit SecE [Gammaproteobacteria bacterium]MDH5593980.1 preprotein translocase subunit SecE [Gammaproteobacteria bacterium]
MDNLKLSAALILVAGAIVGFYVFADQSLLLRVIGLLVVIGISTAIAWQTELGKRAVGYVGDARTEVRKIVWPTRKETIQTTAIVMVMVIVVSIILWAFDVFLVWAVRLLTGQGG